MAYPYDTATNNAIADLALVNGGNYDAGTNPHGLGQGGHRVTFASDLNEVATVAVSISDAALYTAAQATAAAASATSAASAAANLSGSSATSITIGNGPFTFTTQSGKDFAAGRILRITSDANPGVNWMDVLVTSYSGTSLGVSVLGYSGSGAHTDWTIRAGGYPGRGSGRVFHWSTNTANSDPTAGLLKVDNATLSSVANLYVSKTDWDGNSIGAILALWAAGTSTVRGRVVIEQLYAPTNFLELDITGSVTDNSTWDAFTVNYVTSGGTLANGAPVSVRFFPKGDLGTTGATGASGATGATGPTGRASGLAYLWSTNTSSSDPTSGRIKVNNATIASANAIYISETDNEGNGLAALIASWFGGSSTVKGRLEIRDPATPTNFASFDITGTLSDNGSWDSFAGTYVAGGGAFTNALPVMVRFEPKGDKGDTGPTGAAGSTGATGATGRASGIPLVWSTATGGGDPGSTKLAVNNASLALASTLYISETDRDGKAISALINSACVASSVIKGEIWIYDQSTPANFVGFNITSTLTDNGGWDNFTVSHLDHGGTLADAANVLVHVMRTGDKGDTGDVGATGPTGAAGPTGPSAVLRWTFDSSVTDSIPSSGNFRINNATYGSASYLYFNNNEAGATSALAWLNTFDDSTNSGNRGRITLVCISDPTKFAIFTVTGALIDGSGYQKIPVSHVVSAGPLTGLVSLEFAATGNVGSSGAGTGDTFGAAGGTDDHWVKFSGDGFHLADAGARSAANVANVPAGSITSITVQLALNELDTLKAPKASPAFTGTLDAQGAIVFSGVLSPTQITAQRDDYAPTSFSANTIIRINSDAARSITGLAGGAAGRRVCLDNVGSFAITLKAESNSSTAANRFTFYGATDIVLNAGQSIWLRYDNATSRWRAEGQQASEKLPLSGGTMTGIVTLSGDPVSSNDAATKNYVDNVAAGLSWKPAVLLATTVNITLSGEQTIDGTLTSASRVLVKNQSTPSQNGIYVSGSGAWTRATDMDAWAEVPSTSVWVEQGTANGDTGWVCTADPGGTIGSTSITFVQFGASAFATASAGVQKVGQDFRLDVSGLTEDTSPDDANDFLVTYDASASAHKKVKPDNFGYLSKAGGTLSGALNFTTRQTVASAGTADIGAAAGNYVQITGTTTITALGTIAAGALRIVEFAGALTLTHNASSLILPGAANITTAAGDCAIFVSEGSGNWRCVAYVKANGQPVTYGLSGSVVGTSDTQTLTNKRVTPRVVTVTQSATPVINTDNTDTASITALAQAITSMTTNLSGTPLAGDKLIVEITDNGTARAITWGASFEASTVALPTTTVISTKLTVGFIYNGATSKWRCVATA